MGSRKSIRDLLTLPALGSAAPTARGRVLMFINPSAHGWNVTSDARSKSFPRKADAKVYAIRRAHNLVRLGHTVSLYISGLDGKFQEERTYPRGADPSETPG